MSEENQASVTKTKKPKNSKVKVQVVKSPTATLPAYKTKGAAAMDLYANITMPLWINPGEIKLIPTGLKVAIPEGYVLKLYPRSGLASKGITLSNCVGVVDSDYRDQVMVALINQSDTKYQINKNDRIAQVMIEKVISWEWEQVATLDETDREGGFGSTGV